MKVLIDDILITKNRRKVNQDKVKELAESIKEIGLLNPIILSKDYILFAGAHRLEACKLLGYPETRQGRVQASGMNRVLGYNVSADSANTFVEDISKKQKEAEEQYTRNYK